MVQFFGGREISVLLPGGKYLISMRVSQSVSPHFNEIHFNFHTRKFAKLKMEFRNVRMIMRRR